jgi:hypothetical protein
MGRAVKSGTWSTSTGQLQVLNLSDMPTGSYALVCFSQSGQKIARWIQKH